MAADAVDRWSAMSDSNGEVEIDVSEWYQSLTLDVITKTAFGAGCNAGKAVFQLQSKQMTYAVDAFRNISVPGYRFLPTQKNMDAWRLNKEVNKMLARTIDSRKKSAGPGDVKEGKRSPKDLLSFLLVNNDGYRPPITAGDMVEECKTFFFAGTHTTSYMLTWSTVLLAMHPEWQEWARQEVLHVCGDQPTKDHVNKLKTLGMVLNETLRLYPPVVAMIRRAKADVELGGKYKIPASTEIMLPILAVHHDPELWGSDSTEFRPTRFAQGTANAARHPTAFIPFGLGPRTCIGQNLAMLEAKLALAIILQRFTVSVSPSYVHSPTVLMLLYPQFGAPLVFRRRDGR